MGLRSALFGCCLALMLLLVTESMSAQARDVSATASVPDPVSAQEDTMPMRSAGWQLMQDGVVFGTFSHQNGPRGSSEFRSQNWWMGMATRGFSSGAAFTLTSMASLEPATVGRRGYAELFQVGETFEDVPLVDRQHPHDLFMQLSSAFRMPVGDRVGLTIAGGLVGDPALGPTPFMHRQSAAENPLAPLSHHTLDSTHVAMGVITAGVDVGRIAVEGSVFQGAEPDENRWDLHLLFPGFLHAPHPGELIDPLTAVTIGGVRDLSDFSGFNLGLGGDVILYSEPSNLTRTHGETPVAFHVFLRLRIPAKMGRMWGHTMGQPMRGHREVMDHSPRQ